MRSKARIVFSNDSLAILEVKVEVPKSYPAFRLTIPSQVLETLGVEEGDTIFMIIVKG